MPAREVVTLADAMGLPRDQFMRAGLARSTVERKITQRGPLSQAESEKLVGVERLIGQVDAMVREAGTAPDVSTPFAGSPAGWPIRCSRWAGVARKNCSIPPMAAKP